MNKKNYISPVSRVYNVSTAGKFMENIFSGPGTTGEDAETKEQKTGSAGIWDLYNN